MGVINPDMSEVAEVKPGSYPATITKAETKESKKNPGNYYVEWQLQVGGCTEAKYNGLFLPRHNTMITGKGAIMLKRFYMAATKEADMPKSFDTDDIIGNQIYVTVGPQTSNPEYMEVKKVAAYNDQPEVIMEGN